MTINQACQVLPVNSLRPGMRLAEAIRDRLGNIMLVEGVELTEAHLSALAQRGIGSAMIVPERIPPSDQENAAMRASVEARLRTIFRSSLDHTGNHDLFDILLAYRLDHLK